MGERSDFRPNDTDELKDRWRTYITEHRLNTTAQREAIVEQFLRTRDHVSIDEHSHLVQKRGELRRRRRGRERRGHGTSTLVSSNGTVSMPPDALTRISTRFSAEASRCWPRRASWTPSS